MNLIGGEIARSWKILSWLFSLKPREVAAPDAAAKLQASMRVTARCRYNAATRLQKNSRFAFFATISLSLGLIFVPLTQLAGMRSAFSNDALSALQIFLAVASLVYSVVIATWRYEVRAENLTECGDRVKELIRALDKDRRASTNVPLQVIEDYQRRYSAIVTDTENHERTDYWLAMLEAPHDYVITGIPRITLWAKAMVFRSTSYAAPSTLIMLVVILILDMLGISDILVPYVKTSQP